MVGTTTRGLFHMKITARTALIGVGATFAFATAAAPAQSAQLFYWDCNNLNVPANGACNSSYPLPASGNTYTRFSLANGAGVSHYVCNGSWSVCGGSTTAQDAYSPCLRPSSGTALGLNQSASGHKYNLSAYTC